MFGVNSASNNSAKLFQSTKLHRVASYLKKDRVHVRAQLDKFSLENVNEFDDRTVVDEGGWQVNWVIETLAHYSLTNEYELC